MLQTKMLAPAKLFEQIDANSLATLVQGAIPISGRLSLIGYHKPPCCEDACTKFVSHNCSWPGTTCKTCLQSFATLCTVFRLTNSFHPQDNMFMIQDNITHVRAAANEDHNLPPLFTGVEIMTPAQPLAESNATTIHQKWSNWAVVQADGAGKKISATSDLKAACDSVPWKTIVMCKDNLVTNDCVTARRANNHHCDI